MNSTPILWRRTDRPGHEAARLLQSSAGSSLGGTALFIHEAQPVRLDYMIAMDAAWRTLSTMVAGWIGDREIHIEIEVDAEGRWTMNGQNVDAVAGCIDVDLNFSPSTNLLPIRRLALETGQEATVRAAWLRFPSLTLEPLEQTYRREAARIYRYRSNSFEAVLKVNEAGLVTDYGPWIEER